MKKKGANIPPVGEMRQSQLITTFGPGSLVDLPEHSVMVAGLDYWQGDMREIQEERLASELSNVLGRPITLKEPPHQDDAAGARQRRGIKVFRFPNWYVAQVEAQWEDATKRSFRTRPLIEGRHLRQGKYLDADRKKRNVVPVRFVRACTRGHIEDIDWHAFVMNDWQAPKRGELWLDEGGAANDFREIYVRLMNGDRLVARRALADAVAPGSAALGRCKGRALWLGPLITEGCGEVMKLLPRGATHSYFVQSRRVISIPDQSQALREAVNDVYEDYLKSVDGEDEIAFYRKKFAKVTAAIAPYDDALVWEEIQRRKSNAGTAVKGWRDYKAEEIETFRRSAHGERVEAEDDFTADVLPESDIPAKFRPFIERIVLVSRLREVVAQYGFTRFDDGVPDVITAGPGLGVQPALLAREPTWCPAVENRGEGFFLGFREDAFAGWRAKAKAAIDRRAGRFTKAFELWKDQRDIPDRHAFPGLELVLLHSFSHLLLTAVALECGYSASSLRERVYAGASGYGVLIYTASSGAEGTLGGLVDVGKNLERHLERALELGRTCSNDPICAQHDPADSREERYRHGAACHGCLLIAETSCEMRNEYLDRSLVVRTVDGLGCELFGE